MKGSGKLLFWSESLKEKLLESQSYQRDEYCKMWLKKRDLSLMMEDLIFSSNYEDSLSGFEQRWRSEFMIWSELIDFSNYNFMYEGPDQAS